MKNVISATDTKTVEEVTYIRENGDVTLVRTITTEIMAGYVVVTDNDGYSVVATYTFDSGLTIQSYTHRAHRGMGRHARTTWKMNGERSTKAVATVALATAIEVEGRKALEAPVVEAPAEITAQVAGLVQGNEAHFIIADLEDGKSLGGAMSCIDRGRRASASDLRKAIGDEAFIKAIRELSEGFGKNLETKTSKNERKEISYTVTITLDGGEEKSLIVTSFNEEFARITATRMFTEMGIKPSAYSYAQYVLMEVVPTPAVEAPVAPVKATEAIADIPTDRLREMALAMTSGKMKDEQKTLLMKMEIELVNRAKKEYTEWADKATLEQLEADLDELMAGKKSNQELDVYDFAKHSILVSAYAGKLPAIMD